MQNLLKELLRDIKPKREEELALNKKVNDFVDKINRKINYGKAILGGSGAKGTWLKGTHDADIFVKFDYSKYKNKSDTLSDILEKTLKKIFPRVIRLHGSRDYFQIKQRSFTFEVIPILNIRRAAQAKNITDISPLHAKWVTSHAKDTDEIRLAKAFARAQGIYGAESHIQGFSGYVLEILVVYYGSFLSLIKNAAKWKASQVIDIEKHHKNVFLEVNKSKLVSPLVVIDPVQAGRNAAAAISNESYQKFISTAKKFLLNPSKKFFETKEITIDELKKKAGNKKLLIIGVIPKTGKKDVVGSKLIKALDYITKNLNEFNVEKKGYVWNKQTFFYFILKEKKLSAYKEWEGPPLFAKPHFKAFKKKYRNTYIKNKRIYAKVKRTFTRPEGVIKDIIKNIYLKDKVRGLKLLR